MICYRDKTFCSGGTPRCLAFTTCQKALTEDIQARAKAAAMPISQYLAPTAMPCYRVKADIEKPKVSDDKPRPRLKYRPLHLSDDRWHSEFLREPRRTDVELAVDLGSSVTTIRTHRIRLGIPPAISIGHNRNTKYTKADALALLKIYRQTNGNLAEAGRRAGLKKNTAKHIFRKWKEVFA